MSSDSCDNHKHGCDHAHDHSHDSHEHSHDCQHEHEHACAHDEHEHAHEHDSHDSHGPSHAGEIIPESSLQDMVLKLVTVLAAGLLIGSMGWWWTLPLSSGHEGAGSHEQAEHAPEH